jgi:malate/lactate dehydrogenase
MTQKRTIGIIGAGNVGMAAAYAVFMKQVVGDVILVDKSFCGWPLDEVDIATIHGGYCVYFAKRACIDID